MCYFQTIIWVHDEKKFQSKKKSGKAKDADKTNYWVCKCNECATIDLPHYYNCGHRLNRCVRCEKKIFGSDCPKCEDGQSITKQDWKKI